eukprot:737056-Pleurochrysis_carterae.AAC.2
MPDRRNDIRTCSNKDAKGYPDHQVGWNVSYANIDCDLLCLIACGIVDVHAVEPMTQIKVQAWAEHKMATADSTCVPSGNTVSIHPLRAQGQQHPQRQPEWTLPGASTPFCSPFGSAQSVFSSSASSSPGWLSRELTQKNQRIPRRRPSSSHRTHFLPLTLLQAVAPALAPALVRGAKHAIALAHTRFSVRLVRACAARLVTRSYGSSATVCQPKTSEDLTCREVRRESREEALHFQLHAASDKEHSSGHSCHLSTNNLIALDLRYPTGRTTTQWHAARTS